MRRLLGAAAVVTVALAFAAPNPAGAGVNYTVKASGRGNHGSFSAIPPIRVGDTVTWKAVEGDHQVVADGGAFQSDAFAADYEPHSYSFTFDRPGRYPYRCTVSSMTGMIEVQDPSGGPTTTEPPTTTTTRELYKKPS